METSLHRQLKQLYSTGPDACEVTINGFRIDAVSENRLIEIQYGSLGAIRDKIRKLVADHDVLVVKPLAARKYLVRRSRKGGRIVSSRYSPKRETFLDAFLDLVHFVNVFPHPRLTVELLLTEQEEHRLPQLKGRWTRRKYRVEDRKLVAVTDRRMLQTKDDLLTFLPDDLPDTFSTEEISVRLDIPRWLAQKMAYCLRKTGAVCPVGKRGNTILYRTFPGRSRRAA